MPVGKVKWYDPERGFGFVSHPGHEDVFVAQQVLPQGVKELHAGDRIEFDFAEGRPSPKALRVVLLESARSRRNKKRQHTPEELNSMIADVMTLLEGIQPDLQRGHYPEGKEGHQIAGILRAVARELDS
ncbi:cold-shock protein [Corynebacterium poyangense]|uniref:Cold-shock protein n=1 Tax=Corynebacterium poyangense TaxID=2684405 RepID=A0A7H0SS55_9CORY|nr:cold shock domain-containing protein [Corynebacterium poyangense]QNQ91380.1 cold-shock protein [Corynebacterium poyangense]